MKVGKKKMKTRKELAHLAAVLAFRCNHKNPAWVEADALLLCRIGATASRIATALCNGEIQQDQFAAKKARLLPRLAEAASRYDVRFEIGGDPRGYVLRMFPADGRSAKLRGNTWGGDESGYGI